MAPAPDFLKVFKSALGRNSARMQHGPANAASGSASGPMLAAVAESEAKAAETAGLAPAMLDPSVVDVLAEKLLLAWLRNRYQLLFPLSFNLSRLDEAQVTVAIEAMIAAAHADGGFEEKERARIQELLEKFGANEEIRARFDASLAHPSALHKFLGQVRDIQTGALVYAVSLMTVDQRKPAHWHYLRYLAARLRLSEELTGSLEQRFRSAG